jgi:hypothetical protein
MNKSFLELIDLSLNLQRGMQAIRGVRGGVAALMAVGLTILACGLAPLVWFFDLSATLDYADPLIRELLPTLPEVVVGSTSFLVLALTLMPTIVELLLPRIGTKVPGAAFFVFLFCVIDGITDYPRVAQTLAVYQAHFTPWGWAGWVLWAVLHPVLLLFATFLLELLFVLCVVLILALIVQIAAMDRAQRKGITG